MNPAVSVALGNANPEAVTATLLVITIIAISTKVVLVIKDKLERY